MRRSAACGRASGQVQRDAPAHARRRPDQRRAAQVQRLFPGLAVELDVRRDLGAFSYGFTVNDNQRFTFYRTDEFDTNFNGGAYGTAFVEYRPSPRTAITFNIDNAFNTSGNAIGSCSGPNRAAARRRSSTSSASAIATQFRPDAQAELRRRERHEGGGEGQVRRGVARCSAG